MRAPPRAAKPQARSDPKSRRRKPIKLGAVNAKVDEKRAQAAEIDRRIAENEKREKRERETVKSSGTTVKLPDVSRETFPIDDRLTNGHNEA